MSRLRVRLLGGFHAVRDGGAPVVDRWPRPGAKTIVKMLAVAESHRLHRDRIIDWCWPAAEPAAALRNLRVALHAARHALQPDLPPHTPSAYLVADGDLLLLHPDRVWVDLDEVTALAEGALAESALAESAPASGGTDRLAAAHRALQAELLPEDRYADWAAGPRDRLARLRDRIAQTLADGYLRAGRAGDAIEPLLGLLERTPTDEAAHGTMIQVYLALGRRRQAMGQYYRCVRVLREELGTRPGAELDALYQQALVAPRGRPGATRRHVPAPLRRPPMTPLYGRDRALALLTSPDARVGVVAGEAGVGKTRLVAEVAHRAIDAGGLVLWGAAHDAEGPLPYGPVAEAFDGYLASADPAGRADLAAEYPELTALLPGLGPGPAALGSPAERARLFRAVGGLLDDLAERDVLLVLDDLHASDKGTWQLLYHLSRSPSARPWRIVATVREEDLDPRDERQHVLDALVRQGLAHRVELMRLGRADCDQLVTAALRRAVPDSVAEQVWSLSLGNPLFTVELAGSLADVGPRPRHELASVPLTDGVRRLAAERIDRQDPAIRAVTAVLAAAGADAPLVEIVEVAAAGLHPPLTPAATATALDAAVAARLIEERDVVLGGRPVPGYAFRHPLVRLACYERLGVARRRALHAALGEAANRHRPDAVDVLAYHLSRADDPAAIVHLRRAATRAAALHANDTADMYYRDLLARLDAAGEPEAAYLRLDHAVVLRRLARYAEAERVLSEALAALRAAGDSAAAVRAAAMLAEVLGRANRPADGRAVLDTVDPRAAGVGALTAAEYHLAVGVLAFSTGRYAEGLAAATRAERLARTAGEAAGAAVLARTLANRAACLVVLRTYSAARPAAEEALSLAERAGDTALLCRVLSILGELARGDGRLDDARRYAERALAEAERNGDPTAIAFERGNLARVHLLLGDAAAAERLAAGAVELARPLGNSWCLAYTLVNRAEVHLGAGQLAAATACLDESAELATRTGDQQALAGLRALRAELALSAGDPVGALAALADDVPAFVAPLRVRALVAAGRPGEAVRLAQELVDGLVPGERLTEAETRYALGLALAAAGDHPGARRQLAAVVEAARRMPYPALVARAEAALRPPVMHE